MEKQITDALATSVKGMKLNSQQEINSINNALDENKKDKSHIRSLINELEARYWKERKIYNNSARYFAYALRDRINSGILSIDHIIDEFLYSLEQCQEIRSTDHALYFEILNMIGEEYSSKKTKIEEILKSK